MKKHNPMRVVKINKSLVILLLVVDECSRHLVKECRKIECNTKTEFVFTVNVISKHKRFVYK